MQALHKAGDALFQAVNGMVLRIVATEAIAQASEGISNQLQIAGPFVSDGSSSFSCRWKEKTIALRVVSVVAGHLVCLSFHTVSQKDVFVF